MKKMLLFLFGLLISVYSFGQLTQKCNTALNDGNNPVVIPGNSNSDQTQTNWNSGTDVMTTWVLPSTGSTSGNSRIPRNATNRYQREEYLILPSEMAAGGFPSGYAVNAIGFLIATAGVGTQTGQLNIYLMNTSDVTYTLGTNWTTAGFTQVSSDPAFTVPIAAGTYSIPFVNGSTFTYTGGGVYVAWEFSNPAEHLEQLPLSLIATRMRQLYVMVTRVQSPRVQHWLLQHSVLQPHLPIISLSILPQ